MNTKAAVYQILCFFFLSILRFHRSVQSVSYASNKKDFTYSRKRSVGAT